MKKIVMLLVLAVFTQVLLAQDVTMQGRVTYKGDGSALAGVTIVVVGTNAGVLSGADGTYTIAAKIGAAIKFTFVGMNPVEAIVTSNILNVEMTEALTD